MKKIIGVLCFMFCLSAQAQIIPPRGGGESNTGSNLGSGEGVFYQKDGVDFEFKSLTGEMGYIDVSSSATEIDIAIPRVTTVIGTDYGEAAYDGMGELWMYHIYVDPAGNDTTGDGTSGTPFATLQKALDITPKWVDTPNYYINLAAGTYSETPIYYYDPETDPDGKTGRVATIKDFYGEGRINISISGSAELQLCGDNASDEGGGFISITNNRCPIYISGGKLTMQMTNAVGHPTFYSVHFNTDDVRISNQEWADDNTYTGSKSSYAVYLSSTSFVRTSGVTYTAGKEAYRSFRQVDGFSTILTDGNLDNADNAQFYEISNAWTTAGDGGYKPIIHDGIYLSRASQDAGSDVVLGYETLEILQEYTQTETDLADAVSKKHAGSHSGTAGYLSMFSAENILTDATNTDMEVADAVTASHTQNTDQYLDYGGGNQVAVADVKDAVDKKHVAVTIGTANGLSLSDQEISLAAAGSDTTGALTATDWNTFNNKQDALSTNNLTETTSNILTITGGTGAVIGSGTTIEVAQADTDTSGYLSNTDWNTFNNKLSTEVYRQVLSASVSSDTELYLLDGARTTYYDMTLSGDCEAETVNFNGGASPEDGDSLIIRVTASGAARTLSFLEGGDNTFAYGSTLTSTDITETVQDKVDYVGCTWNDSKKRWLIISYSKGF